MYSEKNGYSLWVFRSIVDDITFLIWSDRIFHHQGNEMERGIEKES